jgi:hypothetical protein
LFTKIVDEVANSNGQLKWASLAITHASQLATREAIAVNPSSSTHRTEHVGDSH